MAEDRPAPPRHSAAADAAAVRWSEQHPDDELEHPPPPRTDVDEQGVPNRHSASAESANVRWRDRQGED